MTLSVVIPAHNAADTLAATLDSLLAQTRVGGAMAEIRFVQSLRRA